VRCGSCGADMVIVGGRFVCLSCGFNECLDDLLSEYRTVHAEFAAAEDPNSPGWSPIRAACLEPSVDRLAREIADLVAAQPSRMPARV
jgi:hypothetical protein